MNRFRISALIAALAMVLVTTARPAQAQTQDVTQVVSANPFGLLLELFNGEYERVVGTSATAGFGGSYLSQNDDNYTNADVFYRFYPQGTPLEGWAFGAKVGLTSISDIGTYFGYGFDANRSWLLGAEGRFYVGVGFGLKKLVGVDQEQYDVLEYIPTFRIVNIGIAF